MNALFTVHAEVLWSVLGGEHPGVEHQSLANRIGEVPAGPYQVGKDREIG